MPSLAERLDTPMVTSAHHGWTGYEFARGWGVFGLPFDSGHVLALRVFPQSSFGPYRTLWHRDPTGRWSIYADAADPDRACHRYFGPATTHEAAASIDLTWTGPRTLQVELDHPALSWRLTATTSAALSLANAISSVMPRASWRPAALVHARERAAHALGMGRMQLAGTMPSGHAGLLMPRRMYFVDTSTATLDGRDLGRPVHLDHNPTIGEVPLPARGILAQGEAVWQMPQDGEPT